MYITTSWWYTRIKIKRSTMEIICYGIFCIVLLTYTSDSAESRIGHYSHVIMGTMASQINSLTIVYSTVYSGADQRKHQSSASLAFVPGDLPAQMASNAENVSIWWRHHDMSKPTNIRAQTNTTRHGRVNIFMCIVLERAPFIPYFIVIRRQYKQNKTLPWSEYLYGHTL